MASPVASHSSTAGALRGLQNACLVPKEIMPRKQITISQDKLKPNEQNNSRRKSNNFLTPKF